MCAHCASESRRFTGQLRSELEWIPLKAMAKDRDERYRRRGTRRRRPQLPRAAPADRRAAYGGVLAPASFLPSMPGSSPRPPRWQSSSSRCCCARPFKSPVTCCAQRLAQSEAAYANETAASQKFCSQATIEQAEALYSPAGSRRRGRASKRAPTRSSVWDVVPARRRRVAPVVRHPPAPGDGHGGTRRRHPLGRTFIQEMHAITGKQGRHPETVGRPHRR